MIDEHQRLPHYRKNAVTEQRLWDINQLLEPLEKKRLNKYYDLQFPVAFIVGLPRSGTTLLSQLLAARMNVGYISNFLARFWLAPGIGAEIERSLGIRNRKTSNQIDFVSEYGVTAGWHQPHEFGYFWNRWFDVGQDMHYLTAEQSSEVDAGKLRQSVASIEAVFGLPMVFKNNTWCTMAIPFLAQTFPSAIFVVSERDPQSVCLSIMRARLQRYGDVNTWWSVRPPNFLQLVNRPWEEQIVCQVQTVMSIMEQGLSDLGDERVLRVPYHDVCANPVDTVERIAHALGAEVSQDVSTLPSSFGVSVGHGPSDSLSEKLLEAYAKREGRSVDCGDCG